MGRFFDSGLDPGDDYEPTPAPPPPDAEGGPSPEPYDPPPDPPDAEGGDAPPRTSEPEPTPPDAEGGRPAPPDPEWYEVPIWLWSTANDARVCPVCGPLDGQEFSGDAGPWPPAHVGCRCTRTVSRRERFTRKLRGDTLRDIDRPPDRAIPADPDQGGVIRRF